MRKLSKNRSGRLWVFAPFDFRRGSAVAQKAAEFAMILKLALPPRTGLGRHRTGLRHDKTEIEN